jgi:uncharacterized protein YggE
MALVILVLISLAICASSHADVIEPGFRGANGEGITVHGHSELKVKPDIAYINLSVTTQTREQSEAVATNAQRSVNLIAALKKVGIASQDIQTQSYTVQPQYDYNTSPPLSVGYQVTNSFQVTIRDLTKVGLILDTASKQGSTSAGDVQFDISDHSRYQGEALVAAVADAKSRADLMAGAAGVSLGRLVSLSDTGIPTVTPIFMQRKFSAMASPMAAPTTPVQDQQVDITADVEALYAISQLR